MYFDQEKINELLWEDYRVHEERLRICGRAAEEMLAAGEYREEVWALLFWAKVEFHRRRLYLGLEEPEVERWGGAVVQNLAEKIAEKQGKRS